MPAKLTLEAQKERANIIHNNYYTYKNYIYTNSLKPSWITCPKHLPSNHKRLEVEACYCL